ncbi:MAG TPA: hypothetical protein VLB46_20970 [Pyrinomonadaceae bacterium]|nr:hypothetical protein [Pyrinomonadaceae bacterium]
MRIILLNSYSKLAVLVLSSALFVPANAQAPKDECQSIASRINILRAQVESNQQAIRNLHFEKSVAEAEEWAELSQAARKELVEATLNAYFENLLNLTSTIAKIGSLSPPKANKLISDLRALGIDEPYLFVAIRKLASVRGKPAVAKQVANVIERFRKAKDATRTSGSDEGMKIERLQGLVMAVGMATEIPGVEIVIADAEAFAALVYSGAVIKIGDDRVAKITQQTEDDLRSLKRLFELLATHVRELNEAKQQLSSCEQQARKADEQRRLREERAEAEARRQREENQALNRRLAEQLAGTWHPPFIDMQLNGRMIQVGVCCRIRIQNDGAKVQARVIGTPTISSSSSRFFYATADLAYFDLTVDEATEYGGRLNGNLNVIAYSSDGSWVSGTKSLSAKVTIAQDRRSFTLTVIGEKDSVWIRE